ncbi:hypothetical protein AtubIFM61612_011337 [Aspergillus tubingensis]|nr:hypothetical protein AtubIFM57143_003614 [Aspergillus tubingensis]GLB21377.1 hypothetical protein AtubIFM61612_011337 [Aspergillus tubingensis]
MEVSHIDVMEAEAFELPTNITTIPQTPVQSYIQEKLAAILDEMSSPYGQPSITLKQRGKRFASLFINPQTQALETSEMQTYTTYRWPGRDENEAWRFTVALRVLAAIAEAVQAGLLVSKRTQDIQKIDLADVAWAVYRRLASSNYHLRSTAGKGILVTGKGYPDLNTRAFVRKIFDHSRQLNQQPQFYALVDGDPDGMAIMATYKYGSVAFAHENRNLNVPGLHWLGLKITDVVAGAGLLGDSTLICLTKRDRKKIVAMLSRNPIWAADGPEPEWRVELQRMLMLNVKAETEILYDMEGGLTRWLDRKLSSR